MTTESEFRRRAETTQLQLEAIDWVNKISSVSGVEHTISCASEDMTGYPAPCTCGASGRARIPSFIKKCILEYKA